MKIQVLRAMVTMIALCYGGNAFSSTRSPVKVDIRHKVEREDARTFSPPSNLSRSRIELDDNEQQLCHLTLELRNMTSETIVYDAEWCILSEHIGKTSSPILERNRIIYDSGKLRITLLGKETVRKQITSKPMTFSSWTEYPDDTSSYDCKNGDQYYGYVLFLTRDGKVIEQYANPSRLLKDDLIQACRSHLTRQDLKTQTP